MDQVDGYLRSSANFIIQTTIQPSSVIKAIHLNRFFMKQTMCLAGIYDIHNVSVDLPQKFKMERRILLHKGKLYNKSIIINYFK